MNYDSIRLETSSQLNSFLPAYLFAKHLVDLCRLFERALRNDLGSLFFHEYHERVERFLHVVLLLGRWRGGRGVPVVLQPGDRSKNVR